MNASLSCLQVKDPRKMKFPLKSVESSKNGIESDTGNHRPPYETGRNGTMSEGLSGGDL